MPTSAVPLLRIERGEVEEGIQRGHLAAVDAQGTLVTSQGDPSRLTYFRSCAKPFQAIAALRTGIVERFGLTAEHVAIMCASHSGEPRHVAVVRDLLAHAEIDESSLQCGTHWPYDEAAASVVRREMTEPLAVFNNCSGKHSGMLAAARVLEAALASYLEPSHPVQQRIRQVVEEFTGCAAADVIYGIDGCSAPNAAVPLSAMARSFAQLVTSDDDAARTAVEAMTTHPFLIGGTKRFDTALMEVTNGWPRGAPPARTAPPTVARAAALPSSWRTWMAPGSRWPSWPRWPAWAGLHRPSSKLSTALPTRRCETTRASRWDA